MGDRRRDPVAGAAAGAYGALGPYTVRGVEVGNPLRLRR